MKLNLGRDSEDQDLCLNFSKQNSTLGSVVPLAMFNYIFKSRLNGNSTAVYLRSSLCKIPSFSGGGGLQKGNLMRGSVELERIPGIPKLA